MLKHIVMFRLLDEAHGNDKATNGALIKQRLEDLEGVIPGLLKMEVGLNIASSDMAADVVVYSELESRDALAVYQKHPAHVEVVEFILAASGERRVVDYEVS